MTSSESPACPVCGRPSVREQVVKSTQTGGTAWREGGWRCADPNCRIPGARRATLLRDMAIVAVIVLAFVVFAVVKHQNDVGNARQDVGCIMNPSTC